MGLFDIFFKKTDVRYYSEGCNLMGQKRWSEALTSFDKAIAINPKFPDVWVSRGVALGNLGRLEESLASFDKAIAINPKFPEVWLKRGVTLANLGRHAEAVASYDKALVINPRDTYALENRRFTVENISKMRQKENTQSSPSIKTEQPVDFASDYQMLSSQNNYDRTKAAEFLIEKGGIEGVRLLAKAMKSNNQDESDIAKWAFIYRLSRCRQNYNKDELRQILDDVNEFLINEIKNVNLQPAPTYFDFKTNRNLSVLKEFGNSSSLTALNTLLEKVTTKRQKDGYVKIYVQTDSYGGYQDNDGWNNSVKEVIDAIKKR